LAYGKGCELGAAEGCAYQAEFLRSGRGATRDEGRAATLYRSACDKQVALGCFGVAHYELDGSHGIAKNSAHAEEQLTALCRNDHLAAACFELTHAYGPGGALKADPAKVSQYMELSCTAGIKSACEKKPPEHGPVPPPCPNLDRLNERCEGGDGESCIRLGQLYERGRCAAKNVCEGHRLYKQGCVLHEHAGSCTQHDQFHKQSYGNQCGG